MKTLKHTISLKEFDQRFSKQDKKEIEKEAQYMELLINLRETRQKMGLTQNQLAVKSHIPRATITKIENGQRNATLRTLVSLGEAMGKTLELNWV